MKDISKSSYTVSELNNQVSKLLDSSFSSIWLIGEISNFHHHASGHIYFTLKDNISEMKCVFFRQHNIHFKLTLENGIQIKSFGSISLYKQKGQVQFIIERVEFEGEGSFYLAYEALKTKLMNEGLFLNSNKNNIPNLPNCVGVITSGTGSVLKDIIQVLKRRAPHVNIILRSVIVQGVKSAEDIESAIKDFQRVDYIDTIIIARGGGSIEDLWSFNNEKVVRAISLCQTPIISAIGHETDTTLTDLVSDLRASTPSSAAELVSLSKKQILDKLSIFIEKTIQIIQKDNYERWQKIDSIYLKLELLQPQKKIELKSQKLFQIKLELINLVKRILDRSNNKIVNFEKQLSLMNIDKTLERGFSLATNLKTKQVIRSSNDIKTGDALKLTTSLGYFLAKKIKKYEN